MSDFQYCQIRENMFTIINNGISIFHVKNSKVVKIMERNETLRESLKFVKIFVPSIVIKVACTLPLASDVMKFSG